MEETLKSILQVLTEIRDQNTELKARVEELEDKRILSTKDAALYLNCSKQTIINRTKKGLLKQHLIGGRKGYLLSELNKIKQQ